MRNTFFVLFMLLTLVSFYTPCFAGWIVFHKPPYKAKLIDAETKEPIEGAVVVAIYQKHPFISGPGGGSSSIVGVKEAVTDKNGEFSIPTYTTLMGPNSYEEFTSFLFYKPGYYYAVGIYRRMSGDGREEYLLEKNYGKIENIYSDLYRDEKIGYGPYGVVELKPAKTWEDRRKASWISMPTEAETETPLLYEMRERESEWLKQNKGWRR